ncbi:MAG TPA: flagellar hook-associated protein FlgL [Desulfomonilia bacterium]|nr:flagellar hook-associated protein FlgL [Desulfomonilia bacterium]
MKVSNRLLYYQLRRDLSQNTEKLFKLNNQISAGKRISTPSDDPLGLASVLIYRTELNSYTQYGKSIDYSKGWLNRMDSVLQDTDDLMSRADEIAVQMANASQNSSTRTGAAQEVAQLRAELLSNANAKYGNKYMFGGTQTQTQPYIDVDINSFQGDVTTMSAVLPAGAADGDKFIDTAAGALHNHILQYSAAAAAWNDLGVPADGTSVVVKDQNEVYLFNQGQWKDVYQGNDTTFSVQIGKGTTAMTNIPGSDIFSNSQGNAYATLLKLEKALRSNDVAGITASIGDIDNSSTVVANNLAKVGAVVNELDHTKTVIDRSTVDTTSSMSNIEDLDYAEAITSLQNQQTIYQATLKSASMITSLSLVDFIK